MGSLMGPQFVVLSSKKLNDALLRVGFETDRAYFYATAQRLVLQGSDQDRHIDNRESLQFYSIA